MNEKKLIRDPIYNLISFDKESEKILLNLISLPIFQRLRRIKQLGFSSYTFPSAVHNRFSHSIGVAYLIGVIIDNLNVPSEIEISVIDEKIEKVKRHTKAQSSSVTKTV